MSTAEEFTDSRIIKIFADMLYEANDAVLKGMRRSIDIELQRRGIKEKEE